LCCVSSSIYPIFPWQLSSFSLNHFLIFFLSLSCLRASASYLVRCLCFLLFFGFFFLLPFFWIIVFLFSPFLFVPSVVYSLYKCTQLSLPFHLICFSFLNTPMFFDLFSNVSFTMQTIHDYSTLAFVMGRFYKNMKNNLHTGPHVSDYYVQILLTNIKNSWIIEEGENKRKS